MSTAVATAVVTCPNCLRRNRVPAAADGDPRCGNCHRPLPWITEADDTSFGAIADNSPRTVLVDLWATWCGPCRMVSPALQALATEMADQLKLVTVDIDRSPALAQRFQIQSVPTLLIMRNAEIVARQSGAAPVAVLRTWVQDAIHQSERGSS